ncbi:MAG: class I SAM-dependent methyltransferase [Acidobacteriota bacterium]|nr:class I SAM-dependent methyltransferase [Acidobacteriota bacterium]
MSEPVMSASARRQGELWSADARVWADEQEFRAFPAVERALELVALTSADRVLDVACGAGGAVRLAAPSGARLDGVDASTSLIEIARERTPSANLSVADMMHLPFRDEIFDVVCGFNAFQYPTDPVGALREARRVAKVGARFALVIWGSDEQCEASAHFRALRALLAPAPPGTPPPLAADQRVTSYLASAGLTLRHDELVSCPWDYPNAAEALRAMRSAGPVQRVIEQVGERAVNEALLASFAPFTSPSGAVHYDNQFRVLVATND